MTQQTNAPLLEQALSVAAQREQEFIRLYRPLPEAERFHRSLATERILLGGNRAGKTLSGFCELASAVTGIPITTRDGEQIPDKWPQRALTIWVIGLDEEHLATPCYRVLFEPNQFKTVQNADGSWRSWNPETDPDVELNSQPLIPRRFYKKVTMEDPKKSIPHSCEITSGPRAGTVIYFYSSRAEPKVGDPIDGIFIDDEIFYERHIPEWQARLSDRKGRFVWASIPSSKNPALENLCEKADEQVGRPQPDTEKFVLTFTANPFIDAEEKRKRREGWSEDEARIRELGELTTDKCSRTHSSDFSRRAITTCRKSGRRIWFWIPGTSSRQCCLRLFRLRTSSAITSCAMTSWCCRDPMRTRLRTRASRRLPAGSCTR